MRFSRRLAVVVLIGFGTALSAPLRLIAQPTGPSISYTVPKDGEVTLGIYDQQGQLVRTVISAETRSQGKSSETWDGLDQWGKPVPAGSYLLKGIYHPTITTDYAMTFGNPGNPPWPTMDGKGDW